jgi:dienelactone hydrolase
MRPSLISGLGVPGCLGGKSIRCSELNVVIISMTISILLIVSEVPFNVIGVDGDPGVETVIAPDLDDGPWPVLLDRGYVEMSSGPRVPVDVLYPGYTRLRDRPARDEAAPFPVIIFSPGFGAPALNYESYLSYWASWGFVVAGVSWQYEDDREQDVAYRDHGLVLTLLDEMATDIFSPFYQVPDTSTCGAVGHSRGGRAAFMSSSAETRISAVSAWMPTLNNSDQVRATAWKYLFGGSEDDIASPEEWLLPLYNSSEEPIVYLEVNGGDHSTDADIHPVMTLDFFRCHLLGDASVEDDIYGDGVKTRAESGEFRLRMKMDGEEYDSIPSPPEKPDGPSGGEGKSEASRSWSLVVVLFLVALAIVFILPSSRHMIMDRIRRRSEDTSE